MPRVHPSVLIRSKEILRGDAASQQQGTTLVSRLRGWLDRPGSLLLLVGWSALGLVVLDRYLQHVDRQDAARLVASVALQQRHEREAMHRRFASAPALYEARVVTAYHEMGGTHGLRARVEPGDILEVLQENVGPSGLYLTVRTTARPASTTTGNNGNSNGGKDDDEQVADPEPPQIGWYPRAFVTAVEGEVPAAGTAGRGLLRRIWRGGA